MPRLARWSPIFGAALALLFVLSTAFVIDSIPEPDESDETIVS